MIKLLFSHVKLLSLCGYNAEKSSFLMVSSRSAEVILSASKAIKEDLTNYGL